MLDVFIFRKLPKTQETILLITLIIAFSFGKAFAQDPEAILLNSDTIKFKGLRLSTMVTTIKPIKEFNSLQALLDKRQLSKAMLQINKILALKEDNFNSIKRLNFIKGTANYIKAEILLFQDSIPQAIDYFHQSLLYGNPFAAYKVAELSSKKMVQMSNENPEFTHLAQLCKSSLITGAELGQIDCINLLCTLYNVEGNLSMENYWFLISLGTDSIKQQIKIQYYYDKKMSALQKKNMYETFKEHAFVKDTISNTLNLPGRSLVTSALIEYHLSLELSTLWSLFFDDKANKDSRAIPMAEAFEYYRDDIHDISLMLDAFVLIRNTLHSSIVGHISMSKDDLIQNICPGDRVIVNCGVLTHYATVWSIDRKNDKILFADPYYDFWEPTHNNCFSSFKKIKNKYNSIFTEVSLKELTQNIIGVFTARDNNKYINEYRSKFN